MMFDLRIRDLLSKKTIEQQQLKLEETNNGLQLTNIELKKSLKALDESQNMVLTLIQALESKDTYTCGHSERVAEVVIKFARYLGLSELDQTALWRTGILHDLGKLGIPDAILNKNGPLTTEEWTIMQSHPANSELICSKLNFTRGILPIIRSHHERYDGTGYPDRLKEDDIPFLARIITIADSVDAIISKRPYRHARSLDEALNELEKGAGTQFDPYLVQAFLDFTKAQLSR
ncbi:MAG TPA: HD-GYP domain-containing protein [Desulfosporosinus sp.]|nr:HD-GYP domain-containing protein [Desulfosporosinus sp.]